MASVDTSLLPKNCNRYTLTNYQLTYLIFERIVYILVLNSDLVYFLLYLQDKGIDLVATMSI